MKKALVSMTVILFLLLAAIPVGATAPVSEIAVTAKDAVIDGVVSPYEWVDATPVVLDISGAGSQDLDDTGYGRTSATDGYTDADFSSSIQIMATKEYFYVLDQRVDKQLVFTGVGAGGPHLTDAGCLMWVINQETGLNQQFCYSVLDESGETGFLAYTPVEYKFSLTDTGYVMELKYAFSDLGFTYDELASGKIQFTYCCVNVINPEWDGDGATWGAPNLFQLQYVGINSWEKSPYLKLVEQTTFETTAPETEAATEAPATETPTESAPATGDIIVVSVAVLGVCCAAAYVWSNKKR